MSISENELFSQALGKPLRYKLLQDAQDMILNEQLHRAYNKQVKSTNVWRSDKRVYKLVGAGSFENRFQVDRVSPRRYGSLQKYFD